MYIQDTVGRLNQGVSRQPDIQRLESYVEVQKNGLSDIVDSVSTRPPTVHEFVAKNSRIGESLIVETDLIESLGDTAWLVVWDNTGTIAINQFEADGTDTSVTIPTAVATYLADGSPGISDLQILQTGSRIFILNKKATCAMDATSLTTERDAEMMVWFRQSAGDLDAILSYEPGNDFTPGSGMDVIWSELTDFVNHPGTETYRFLLAEGNSGLVDAHSTTKWCEDVFASLETNATSWITDAGLALEAWTFEMPDAADHVVSGTALASIFHGYSLDQGSKLDRFHVEDGFGNQGVRIAGPGEVDSLESLPREGAPAGFHVKIVGLNSEESDDFYVQYDGKAWVEAPAQGIEHVIDGETMPIELVDGGAGVAEAQLVSWGERITGDSDTAPDPLFIGKQIQHMSAHKDRLVLLCEDSISMSEAEGRTTSFFPTTLRQVLDTDPIEFDLSSTDARPQLARYAIGTPGGLLILGKNSQSVIRASDNLWAPGRVSNDLLSAVEMDPTVAPVRIGEEVVFLSKGAGGTTVWSYLITDVGGFTAENLTSQVPNYLPTNVLWMRGSFNERLILVCDADNPVDVYAYRFYSEGAERLQGSWSHWEFEANDGTISAVLDGYFKGGDFWMLVEGSPYTGVFTGVVRMKFDGVPDTNLIPWVFCLDNKRELPAASFTWDPVTGFSFIVGVDFADSAERAVIVHPDGTVEEFRVAPVSTTIFIPTEIEVTDRVFVGYKYEFLVQPSKIYRQVSNGRNVIPLTTGRTQLRCLYLLLKNSGPLTVRVTPEGRDPEEKVLSYKEVGDLVGDTELPLFRRQRVDTHGDASKIKIEFISQEVTPVTISGFEWEALYHNRARNARSA